jgi:hypothetical protein
VNALVASARERIAFLAPIPCASVHQLDGYLLPRSGGIRRNPIEAQPWPTVRFALAVVNCDAGKLCRLARQAKVRARALEALRDEDTQPSAV